VRGSEDDIVPLTSTDGRRPLCKLRGEREMRARQRQSGRTHSRWLGQIEPIWATRANGKRYRDLTAVATVKPSS